MLCTLIINIGGFSSVDLKLRHPLPAQVLVSVIGEVAQYYSCLLFSICCSSFISRGEKKENPLCAPSSAELIPHKSRPLTTPAFFSCSKKEGSIPSAFTRVSFASQCTIR